MLAAVLLASTSPVAAYLSSAQEHPFTFNASLRLGMAGGFLMVTLALYRGAVLREAMHLARNPRLLLRWGPAAALIGTGDYMLYALATRHIGPGAAVALMETWPAMVIIVGALSSRNTGRYRLQPARAALAGTIAVAGVVMVIAGQEGSITGLLSGHGAQATLIGSTLALGAGLTLAPVTLAIGWCESVSTSRNPAHRHLPVVYIGLLNSAVSLAGSGVYAAGAAAAERPDTAAVLIPLACGLLTQGVGAMAWRVANHLTDRINLNLILFGLPAAAQLWIWMLGGLAAANTGYLVAGTALIVAANAGAALKLPGRGPTGGIPGK